MNGTLFNLWNYCILYVYIFVQHKWQQFISSHWNVNWTVISKVIIYLRRKEGFHLELQNCQKAEMEFSSLSGSVIQDLNQESSYKTADILRDHILPCGHNLTIVREGDWVWSQVRVVSRTPSSTLWVQEESQKKKNWGGWGKQVSRLGTECGGWLLSGHSCEVRRCQSVGLEEESQERGPALMRLAPTNIH